MSGDYTTTPGQAGTFVLQERQRIDAELTRLREFAAVFCDDVADADKDLALLLLGQWDSEWRSVTEAYAQGMTDGKAEAIAHYAAENIQLKQLLVIAWRTRFDQAAHLLQYANDMRKNAETLARHLEQLGVPLDVNAVTLEVPSEA
jgi:hypothetical protein